MRLDGLVIDLTGKVDLEDDLLEFGVAGFVVIRFEEVLGAWLNKDIVLAIQIEAFLDAGCLCRPSGNIP
jgi:hypothetical protein